MASPAESGTVTFVSRLLGGVFRIASDILRGRDRLVNSQIFVDNSHRADAFSVLGPEWKSEA